jgi:YD repeat-containing protein
VKIAEPRRLTTLVYNGDVVDGSAVTCAPPSALVNGDPIPVLCSQSIQQTSDASGTNGVYALTIGSPSTWTYAYNGFALLTSATDPNGKTTLISYYDVGDANVGKRGNIATITNPLGHVTSITDYDLSGRPLSITDPNGMVTTLTYRVRGWLTSKVVGGETTTYDYDDAGQLKKVTLPDSSFVQFSYDDAHRLTQLQDGLGNQMVYTLDAMGNRIEEDALDPSGQLAATRRRVYDTLNRLHQAIGGR